MFYGYIDYRRFQNQTISIITDNIMDLWHYITNNKLERFTNAMCSAPKLISDKW